MVQKPPQIKEVNIVKEKDQLAVRFPTEFSDRFDINPKTDKFFWAMIEEDGELRLQGRLLKNAKKKDN